MTPRTAGHRRAEYTILFLIVLFVPWMVYVGANLVLHSERYLEKQHHVDTLHQQLHALDNILLTLQEAETGHRGYLLTGRGEYLHPYLRAGETLEALITTLPDALGDEPELQSRYQEISDLARRKLDSLERSVTLAKTEGTHKAIIAMRDGSDRAIMRELRSTINGIRVRKTAALNIEFTDARERQLSTRANALLLFVSLMGFAGLSISVALRGLRLKRKLAERLHEDSHHDALTGLPNRRNLEEMLGYAIAQAGRRNAPFALLYIDLDGFKLVNDRFGHLAGDLLLKEAARQFRQTVREGEMVARLGGDEFAVLMPLLRSPDDADLLVSRLHDVLSRPLLPDFPEARVSASIGIAHFPADGQTAQGLLQHADERMYRAKRSGSQKTVQTV